MNTVNIELYPAYKHQFDSWGLEDEFYHWGLKYSLRHIVNMDSMMPGVIVDAMQKSIRICHLLGINSRYHFKKVYVYDTKMGVLQIDWLMSRNGFNLMIMQLPSINENIAKWLWQLSDS